MVMMNNVITISYNKYMDFINHFDMIDKFHEGSLAGWLERFFRYFNWVDVVEVSPDTEDGDFVIEITFRNEEDAMWFVLKYL